MINIFNIFKTKKSRVVRKFYQVHFRYYTADNGCFLEEYAIYKTNGDINGFPKDIEAESDIEQVSVLRFNSISEASYLNQMRDGILQIVSR